MGTAGGTMSISSVGDISFAGGFADKPELFDSWVDEGLLDFINADISIANLECVFLPEGCGRPRGLFLAEPACSAVALGHAGFNVVSLANNHILDYEGETGMLETMRVLDGLGIRHCGAGKNLIEASRPVIIDIRGVKVAVLSRLHDYSFVDVAPITAGRDNPGVALLDDEEIKDTVKSCKGEKGCEAVVLCLHWGMQNVRYHSPVVHKLGERLMKSGVDLILGSHSHVLQGLSCLDGKYCFYGQGNFYFYPFPMEGLPGGVLYGPEDVVHRRSAVSRFEWDGNDWSADFKIAVQRSDETVGELQGFRARLTERLVKGHWAGNNPGFYHLAWRVFLLKEHAKGIKKAIRGDCPDTRIWYKNPANWKKIAMDMIEPPTLG